MDNRHGQIFVVMSAKGGVGVSTVAVNTAISLRQTAEGKTVAVLDLNLQSGDLPLLLGLEPIRSLRDLVRDPARLDHTIAMSALCRHSSGVHLLASGYEDLVDTPPAADAVERILVLLQSLFDYVVVDGGHGLQPFARPVVARAAALLVVTTLSLPVVRRTRSLLSLLEGAEASAGKSKLIVNRYTKHEEGLLAETEDALRVRMFAVLPNDYPLASAAINLGRPLVAEAPRSELAGHYARMARALTEGDTPRDGASSVAGYWRSLKDKWLVRTKG